LTIIKRTKKLINLKNIIL